VAAENVLMKKVMVVISLLLGLYIIVCGLMFAFQERLIFFPQKLHRDHTFSFPQPFEEINILTEDEKRLHGLLFRANNSKGLVFYLHGNAGSLDAWGEVAETYTGLQYDIFLLDYRGYGKSEGTIGSETQLFRDVQLAYNEMLKNYREDSIVVLGYSIGTGPAIRLASTNHPKLVILQAPYYSLTDVVKHTFPFVPGFLLKYKLETFKYIKDCKMPIVLIHGDQDEVIYYGSSLRLKELLKKSDTLITIQGLGHNGMTDHPDYARAIGKILNQ
jgi:pimeloyl-ACP methyl ester carboxylesterase